MHVYPHEHRLSISCELTGFGLKDSFSSRLGKQIGEELHRRLVEWPIEGEVHYSREHPVTGLFVWLDRDGVGLDPEWLRRDDGSFVDDQGLLLPPNVKPTYTPAEQMAAYGLWLVYEHARQWGDSRYFDSYADWSAHLEQYGVTPEEAAEHVHACLLFGYQAAIFASRLERGDGPTEQEATPYTNVDFAQLGAKGGAAKARPMNELRRWALERYAAGHWVSANAAAHALTAEIIAHGRTINATLVPSNAQRTIADWFRSHNKTPV